MSELQQEQCVFHQLSTKALCEQLCDFIRTGLLSVEEAISIVLNVINDDVTDCLASIEAEKFINDWKGVALN